MLPVNGSPLPLRWRQSYDRFGRVQVRVTFTRNINHIIYKLHHTHRRFGVSQPEAGYMRGFHPGNNPAAYQLVQTVAHQGQVMVAPQGGIVYASEVVKA